MTRNGDPIGASAIDKSRFQARRPQTAGDKLLSDFVRRTLDESGRWRLWFDAAGDEKEQTLQRLEELLKSYGLELRGEHFQPTRLRETTPAMEFVAERFTNDPSPALATVIYAEGKLRKHKKKPVRTALHRLGFTHSGGGASTVWHPPWVVGGEVPGSLEQLLEDEAVYAPTPLEIVIADLERGRKERLADRKKEAETQGRRPASGHPRARKGQGTKGE